MTAEVRAVVVVVPARNEEESIASALRAIRRCAGVISPGIEVRVVVVANGCLDATAEVVQAEAVRAEAARAAGIHLVDSAACNVGAARAEGVQWALSHWAPSGRVGDLDTLWIATTDADSEVPVGWLQEQLRAADTGSDAFLGTVELSPAATHRFSRWVERYAEDARLSAEHGHVHGASLGVRASAYLAAGGFQPLPAHEDADLVHRLEAVGASIARVAHVPVMTSARLDPRAEEGVGADLAAFG